MKKTKKFFATSYKLNDDDTINRRFCRTAGYALDVETSNDGEGVGGTIYDLYEVTFKKIDSFLYAKRLTRVKKK